MRWKRGYRTQKGQSNVGKWLKRFRLLRTCRRTTIPKYSSPKDILK